MKIPSRRVDIREVIIPVSNHASIHLLIGLTISQLGEIN